MQSFLKNGLICVLLLLTAIQAQAQLEAYRGGSADGHSSAAVQNFTEVFITKQGPFAGGSGDGHTSDSLLSFNPRSTALLYAPFAGGLADGHAADSFISFNPRGIATLYSPFFGGIADGHAYDSLIIFNPRAYISKFRPFSGGLADGYYEGVICNFPKAGNDTTVFIACANDSFSLNSLVENYSYAARWNTARPQAVTTGQYELRINNAGKCLDTSIAIVKLDVANWTGTVSDNWHEAGNWSTGKIPSPTTHVVIPASTPNPCIISNEDAVCMSLQAKNSGNFKIINNRQLFVNGTCTVLPSQ